MYSGVDVAKMSLMDALDLAILIEAEAHERYLDFASQLGGSETGYFFRKMAQNEEKHGKEIHEKRVAMFGKAARNVDLVDIFDVEAPEAGANRSTMSVLQAFELGMAAEKKAYDFYDACLRHVTDSEIRDLFIELRDEEEEHYNLLKKQKEGLPASAGIKGQIDHDEGPFL